MDVEAVVRARVKEKRVRVPPAPSACLQLSNLLSNSDWSMSELERIVRSDPAITAVVLRAANAVGTRGRSAVTTIPAAVSRLGARGVLKLGWASSAAALSTTSGPLISLRQRAWREAMVAAHVAQWLSALGETPHDPDTGFVIGMLHDIGRVVTISALEDLFEAHPDADTRTLDGWWALAEDLHQAAGRALIEAWSLPEPLAAAVEFHHEAGPWDWLQTVDEVVAQVEATPHVTAAALGTVATLETPTCLELATRLPELVEAVRLLDPDLPALDGSSAFELNGIQVSTGEHTVSATLLGSDPNGVVVTLEKPLSTRLLVFVRVDTLQFHARAEPLGQERLRLRPWALSEQQATAFNTWCEGLAVAA
jgi:HD-like signal output (HDOD) protein